MNSEEVKAFLREKPCVACGAHPVELHHVKTRKTLDKKDWDNPWNLLPLCHRCHQEWHFGGPRKFLNKYVAVETYLKALGWETKPKLWHSAN